MLEENVLTVDAVSSVTLNSDVVKRTGCKIEKTKDNNESKNDLGS